MSQAGVYKHGYSFEVSRMSLNKDSWYKAFKFLFSLIVIWSTLASIQVPSFYYLRLLEQDIKALDLGNGQNSRPLILNKSLYSNHTLQNAKSQTGQSVYTTCRAPKRQHLYIFQIDTMVKWCNLQQYQIAANPRMILDKRKIKLVSLLSSAQKLPDFTTESSIFTGLVTSPPPTPALKDFEFEKEGQTFATKAEFSFSWNATYNVTKIVVQYNEKDGSKRVVEIPKIDLTANATLNMYPPEFSRKGFRYTIIGFNMKTYYYVEAWAYYGNNKLYDATSMKTGESDRDERIYNLEGIFLVLGISTIIMVVVLCCVGYEKLLHQKKKQCIDILCCRRKSKRSAKVHNRGSISPEPLMVRRDPSDMSPIEDDFAIAGPSNKPR